MSEEHACTDPHHHVHDGAAYVQEVERACEQRGLRLTPIRAHALRLIGDADRPLKAYELLDQMKATHDAAAPPTVYRALDFLLEHGFIHKLASINAFVGCHHPGGEQHAVPFLICDRCHCATELEDEQIVGALDQRARALGFVPQAQTLEVHGLCAACAKQASAPEATDRG
ncbi:MAG: transcriptional repressor [Proteobacteria bacterium]|nr:transcriptional repressor [Pseudomonadota bacterium]